MSETVENLSTLKINYLTQEQYDAAVSSGIIQENELYLTPTSGEQSALPSGGLMGQVLAKSSDDDYAAAWATIDTGHSLPSGGLTGQVLAKSSGVDYAVAWATIHDIPAGGSTGQVLAKSSDDDYSVAWVSADNFGDEFLITVTFNNSTYSYESDKTYDEILAAITAGKIAILKYNDDYYYYDTKSTTGQQNLYFKRTAVVSSTSVTGRFFYIYKNSYNNNTVINSTSTYMSVPSTPTPLIKSEEWSLYNSEGTWVLDSTYYGDISNYVDDYNNNIDDRIIQIRKWNSHFEPYQTPPVNGSFEIYKLCNAYTVFDANQQSTEGHMIFRNIIEESGTMKIKTIEIVATIETYDFPNSATITFSETVLGYPSASGVGF